MARPAVTAPVPPAPFPSPAATPPAAGAATQPGSAASTPATPALPPPAADAATQPGSAVTTPATTPGAAPAAAILAPSLPRPAVAAAGRTKPDAKPASAADPRKRDAAAPALVPPATLSGMIAAPPPPPPAAPAALPQTDTGGKAAVPTDPAALAPAALSDAGPLVAAPGAAMALPAAPPPVAPPPPSGAPAAAATGGGADAALPDSRTRDPSSPAAWTGAASPGSGLLTQTVPQPSPAAPPATAAAPAVLQNSPTPYAGAAGAQVAVQVAHALQNGQNTLVVALHPAELGRVEVRLAFHAGGRVDVQMTLDRPDTFTAFTRDRAALAQQLAQAGINLGSGGLDLRFGRQPADPHARANARVPLRVGAVAGPDGPQAALSPAAVLPASLFDILA